MRKLHIPLILLIATAFATRLFALGESDRGDKPLSEANYQEFPGIMPLGERE